MILSNNDGIKEATICEQILVTAFLKLGYEKGVMHEKSFVEEIISFLILFSAH